MKHCSIFIKYSDIVIKSMAVFSVVFVVACASKFTNINPKQHTLSLTEKHRSLEIEGVNAIAPAQGDTVLANNKVVWFAASEESGIRALDGELNTVHAFAGQYELLDVRSNNNTMYLLTSDSETGLAQLVAYQSESFKRIKILDTHNFQIEGMCLYLNPYGELFAFLLDGYGVGEMRWLLTSTGEVVDKKVKTLRLPPESESCSVDDASDSLFVVEEGLGVWRYAANPESSRSRVLIDLMAPRGNIKGEPVSARFVGGKLMVLTESSINSFTKINGQWSFYQTYETVSDSIDVIEDIALVDNMALLLSEEQASVHLYSLMQNTDQTEKRKDTPLIPQVTAKAQTDPMERIGDAADDPAIWVNTRAPEKSRILGTNKKWGLFVYDLQGRTVQSIPSGHINNVDVRQNITMQSGTFDIAVASNRSDNSITVYALNPKNGDVSEIGRVPTSMGEVYGICLYAPNADRLYTFINDKDGRLQQWQLDISSDYSVRGELVRELKLNSQPEGCVANDKTHELFVGEEDRGVWLFDARVESHFKDGDKGRLVHEVGEHLYADVEGLGLIHYQGNAYLLVSSQGNHTYVLYDAVQPYAYRGTFRVGLNANALIDGTSETDGLDVIAVNLGPDYPEGIVVIQDGFNYMPEHPQNFKYVSWQDVARALGL